MSSSKRKVYVFGSSGFIGKNLSSYLSSDSRFDVITVGREGCDIYADLDGEYSQLVKVIEPHDFFVFLSSVSSPDLCIKEPAIIRRINVDNTIDLIKCLNEKHVNVVFSSSDVVFGCSNRPCNEDSTVKPFGFYAETKALVEEELKKIVNAKVIRFSYVLGDGDKYTTSLKQAVENNHRMEVFRGFNRAIVALDDVLLGIKHLILYWDDIQEKVINFCGPKLVSREELTEIASSIVFKDLDYCVVEAPNGFWDARPKTIDMRSNFFEDLLGRPPYTIQQTLNGWREQQ